MNNTNNTEIAGNINHNSPSTVNNALTTYLKSRSIRSRFLPGLLMLILGAVILSMPIAANASHGPVTMQPANFNYNQETNLYTIVQRAPKIYPQSGKSQQSVGFFPILYELVNGTWKFVKAAPWRQGIAYTNTPWVGAQHTFNLSQFGPGIYKVSADMRWYNNGSWNIEYNQWVGTYNRNDYYCIFGSCGWEYTGTFSYARTY